MQSHMDCTCCTLDPSWPRKIGDKHIGVCMSKCVSVKCSRALTDCWVGNKPLNECPCGRRQGTGSSQDHTEANLRSGRGLGVT